mmetsp:Transcript_13893/g.54884  ORF Transcript_13893/g.54884 Transcript_13893/m.54884 type:complete len:596 (-) Transcript_13893:27-1814(-)
MVVRKRADGLHPAVSLQFQCLAAWRKASPPVPQELLDQLARSFNEIDEATGTTGFAEALVQWDERPGQYFDFQKDTFVAIPRCNRRLETRMRWLFTNHLLGMSPAESFTFLEQEDNRGKSARWHGMRHRFLWSMWGVADKHWRIGARLNSAKSLDELLLLNVRKVWCAAGKRRQYAAMVSLMTYHMQDSGRELFLLRLIEVAEVQNAVERLRKAFVSGLVSLYTRGETVVREGEANIVSYMELLGIDSRHFDATATLDERGIAHCPLGPDLQAFVYPRLLPRHLQLRTKGRMLPVEVLLTRGTVPRRLLELGASLDFGPLPHHRPAVHGARRSAELMLLMLEFEADATALDAEGRTALYEFSRLSGRAVEALVAAGLDPNERGRWPDRPLVTGLQRGAVDELKRLEALQAMIDAGSDLSATLANGCTAMMLVNPAEMDMLHQAGADPEAVSEHGGTALIQFLIYSDQVPPEYLLTERNLTTVCRAHKEWLICSTALGWAVSFNRSSAVIEALLEAGADPNGARESGNCPVTLPEWYRPPVLCSRGNTVSEAARVLAHLGASIPTGLDTGYKFTLAKCRAYNELRTQVLGTRTKRA